MRYSLLFLMACAGLCLVGLAAAEEPAAPAAEWKSLFDGKSLQGWKVTNFAGHGEPRVEEGKIMLPFGSEMTGITYDGKLPARINYEIELDAMRVDGNDFFCALTFPVADDPCTLICGGWGGGVTGLSSIDGMDASENSTSSYREYKKGEWYHIRLRVTKERIQAWIDKDEIMDYPLADHKISIRSEVELSKPLGISTWCTTGAIKNIRMKVLKN